MLFKLTLKIIFSRGGYYNTKYPKNATIYNSWTVI